MRDEEYEAYNQRYRYEEPNRPPSIFRVFIGIGVVLILAIFVFLHWML